MSLASRILVYVDMTTGEKAFLWVVAGLIVIGVFGYTFYRSYVANKAAEQQTRDILGSSTTTPALSPEEIAVRARVIDFGKAMQKVPLMADKTIVDAAMDQNYGDFVEAGLLAQWKADAKSAPGRLTSSPWPDRIEITAAQKHTGGTYTVSGEIVEMSSTGEGDHVPVSITLSYQDGKWVITRYEEFSDKG